MKFIVFFFLFFTTVFNLQSQTISKSSYSAFKAINIDTLLIISGQTQALENSNPNLFIGYLPLASSYADLNSFNASKLILYPNPFTSSLTINFFENNTNSKKIKLFDILGNQIKLYSTTKNKFIIHTENLSKGVYLVSIEIENQTVLTQKIIKL